jgi:hypothetical protein
METLLSTPMTVTIFQISLAMLLCTVLLIIGRVRLALFVTYCFVLYWAKPWNISLYTDTTPAAMNTPGILFIAFCLVATLFAITGLTFHRD